MDKKTPPAEQPPASDPFAPFTAALRERVPSREALLAEGKALTRQRRKARNALGGGLLSVALLAGLWALDPAWRSEDIQVAYGQRERLVLADGSVVQANSGSHLRIEHRLRSRQLELLHGEAMFTVVHRQQAFIVRSQGVRVRDIGTVFDVRSDTRGVQVAVIQGEVEVRNLHDQPRRLVAGEQVNASARAISPVRPAKVDALMAWQHGKLRFDGTPLSEVVADLQHYRQAPIRVADAATGALRLSGEFDSARVETLIQLLPTILPVRAAQQADGAVTLYKVR